ncbi:MAG: hypothetical protein ABI658_32610, partial [Acidimicrobiales bacterium]
MFAQDAIVIGVIGSGAVVAGRTVAVLAVTGVDVVVVRVVGASPSVDDGVDDGRVPADVSPQATASPTTAITAMTAQSERPAVPMCQCATVDWTVR